MILTKLARALLLDRLPDRPCLLLLYRAKMGRRLRLTQPRRFTEKIQWLKLYDRNPLNTRIADKYAVREYISDRVGGEYTVPLVGIWNTFDEIDFDRLPGQFVLKTTHDCGGIFICKDKSSLDAHAAKEKLERRLRRNCYRYYREWAYKNIRPRIIAEEYLEDDSGRGLTDYKFMCFNGHPKWVAVCTGREIDGRRLKVDVFDMQWQSLEGKIGYKNYPTSGLTLERPKSFDRMIELCGILARPFPFVRVDCYNTRGRIYVGELTLYPAAGYLKFQPEELDETIGSWLALPEKNPRGS